MEQDLFENLPSEIAINIFSRLPVRTIGIGKCVCQSWLELLETDDFVNAHFAKSVPFLAVLMEENLCNVFEFADEDEADDVDRCDDRHYNPVTVVDFDFPDRVRIDGSANGLLFLNTLKDNPDAVYVCNVITREFIELGYSNHPRHDDHIFGFGTSKITGEHKVVRIFRLRGGYFKPGRRVECRVYTLGTGSWRSVEPATELEYNFSGFGAFLNGNLHWLATYNSITCVSCFDLETECFSTFLVPPPLQEDGDGGDIIGSVHVLNDRLCLCEDASEDVIVIWGMNESGAERSWSKDYVLGVGLDFDCQGYLHVRPIKVFEDGDMLLIWDFGDLYYYSNKTKTLHEIDIFAVPGSISSMLFTPSFLSLTSLEMEDVYSF